MPRIEYHRLDLTVRIEAREEGVLFRASWSGVEQAEAAFAPELDPVFDAWSAAIGPDPSEVLLPRVVLDVRDERLAAEDWETILRPLLHDRSAAFVRTSPVRPRVASPLALPIRILEIDPGPHPSVSEVVSGIFGDLPAEEVAGAMQTGQAFLWELPSFFVRQGWPTAEILHFNCFDLALDRLLTTAEPEEPGTLGWLLRLTETWQTRLVVLEHLGYETPLLRRLGHALVRRGGPAVLLLAAEPFRHGALQSLYDGLIHDVPLDGIACGDTRHTLFAGAGREEALRPSGIGLRLTSEELWLTTRSGEGESPGAMTRQLMETITFDHESRGILPLSRHLAMLRQMRRQPTSYGVIGAPPRRHVNVRFLAGEPEPQPVPQESARLTPGEVVHLGIQIGEKDPEIQTLGALDFLEEHFRWKERSQGAYIEIGITGIDFDLLGDPVQELWLSTGDPTDEILFALSPKPETLVPGVARLRICLYYRNNLFQSFRVAALLRGWGPSPEEARALLAAALDVPESELPAGDAPGFLTRLEYATVAEPVEAGELPQRALSFAVNDAAGKAVISVKGNDLFEAYVDDNLPRKVERVREALQKVSSRESRLLPGNLEYAFSEANQGDRKTFESALRELAETGWDLYSTLVQGEEARARVEKELSVAGQVVHAAHVDLGKVIPWPLVYDRPYKPGRQQKGGRPVAYDTCLAALGPDGTLLADRCGTLPDCKLLRPGEPLLLEETVACPLHFWGFKHVVEVPAQQASGLDGTPPPPVTQVSAAQPVQVVAALNTGLSLTKAHLAALQAGLQPLGATFDPGPIYDRDDLLDRLDETEPDVVYLYCHTGKSQGTSPAYLEFTPGKITVADLDGHAWQHAPLVFLNGCGTAGLTPTAPSEFIVRLVRQRRASGVIGAEVEVWEALAGEIALLFLERFLDPADPLPAGQALLQARRALLAKNNPLGLVYTLYAPAELRLAPV